MGQARVSLTAVSEWLLLQRSRLRSPPMEAGLVTLAKIVGTLVFSMSVVPLLFLLVGGGERSEPEEDFDSIR